MKLVITLFLSILSLAMQAQGFYQLEMDFSSCNVSDQSALALPITTVGNPACICSPNGDAFLLNGAGDAFQVQDSNVTFGQAFSISLVFRPDSDLDNQRILSYKNDCNSPQGVEITYHGSTNSLTFELYETSGRRVFIEQLLDDGQCWHSVSFVKSGSSYFVYLYGEQTFLTMVAGSFDLTNQGTLTIGSGPCVPMFANAFNGALDYLSIYSDVIPLSDITAQVIQPNEIVTANTLILIGDQLIPEVYAPCATNFSWSPATGVSDVNLAEPTLAPMVTTVYELTIQDGGCNSTDSLRILVVDPSEVTCEELILPTAFTPNNDGLNDTYFISNGFVIEELISFEIFDRIGGKLYSTSDVTAGWDGSHKGQTVMPGVYVLKVEYKCNDEIKVDARSFSVLN